MAQVADNPAAGIRWDLSSLFSSVDDPKIEATFEAAHGAADAFAERYRGRIETGSLSAAELAEALAELERITTEVSKPGHFAGLMFAGDTSDPKLGGFYQSVGERTSEVRVKLMFADLELKAASDDYIERVLADEALANYRHFVRTARAYRPHMLTETEETLLEEVANVSSRAWVRLHDELTSNMVCPYVDPKTGETHEFSQHEVLDLLRSADRAERVAAGDALTKGLEGIERSIVFTYNTLLADKKLEDRLRRYASAEASRHMANELDSETVDLVMQLCKEQGDLVSRYYKAKRAYTGADALTHVDRYAPLFDAEEEIGWDQARTIVLDSFGRFHPEMRAKAEEFFTKNWIDAEARPGKTGGAFCSYNTVDTHPVMLMTYLGKMSDVGTLAHELGHCVHASLSREQTTFNFDGTLPLAELASIFGEALVFDALVAEASERDHMALLAERVEGIFASVYRQSSMFRFEQRCHRHRREVGELSAEEFGQIWMEENQAMFGDSVTMGEQYAKWWLYIGHFFFAPFYVYAYSFGELLALSLYQRAKGEGPEFAERYVDVLRRGGSETPFELMGRLGVDLRSREFWMGGFAAIESLVSQFEALAGRVPRLEAQ